MKCENCGSDFVPKPKANNQKCCSRNCSLAIWRANNRDKVNAQFRDWLKNNQGKHTESVRKWRQENPRKATVETLTNRAIANGKLVRKPCEVCGKTQVHAHHPDYTKHYSNVQWLCPLHHKQAHKELQNV